MFFSRELACRQNNSQSVEIMSQNRVHTVVLRTIVSLSCICLPWVNPCINLGRVAVLALVDPRCPQLCGSVEQDGAGDEILAPPLTSASGGRPEGSTAPQIALNEKTRFRRLLRVSGWIMGNESTCHSGPPD
jgi:hypothetical protein